MEYYFCLLGKITLIYLISGVASLLAMAVMHWSDLLDAFKGFNIIEGVLSVLVLIFIWPVNIYVEINR